MAAFLLQVYEAHYSSLHFANFVHFWVTRTQTLSVSCEHAYCLMLMFGLLCSLKWFKSSAQTMASTYFSIYQTSHFPAKILPVRVLIDVEAVTWGEENINNLKENMLYFSSPFSLLPFPTYVHPTSVQVRRRFLNKRQLFEEKV